MVGPNAGLSANLRTQSVEKVVYFGYGPTLDDYFISVGRDDEVVTRLTWDWLEIHDADTLKLRRQILPLTHPAGWLQVRQKFLKS